MVAGTPADAEDAGERAENGGARRITRTTISVSEWGAYHMQLRPEKSQHIQSCGKLWQEFIVDLYVQAENQRIKWVREHQADIRSELYQNVVQAARDGMVT